jgi:hypothetical protein
MTCRLQYRHFRRLWSSALLIIHTEPYDSKILLRHWVIDIGGWDK